MWKKHWKTNKKDMITIIAEKPSVAQSIARVVGASTRKDGYWEGKRYYVTWAFGHMVEIYAEGADDWGAPLPLLPGSFSLRVGRVRTDRGERADPGYAKQLGIIRSLASHSEYVINAGDAGREGELIQRYIYEYIGLRKPVRRLWISSLTEEAIRGGMEALRPSEEYDALYRAGKARSEADWLIGVNATRALTKAAGGERLLSLGRVQTPTLGLVCRRFLENRDFVSVPIWTVEAKSWLGKSLFTAWSGRYENYREACSAREILAAAGRIRVSSVQKSTRVEMAPLLYDLTTLQKECNRRYALTAEETLSAAQGLYEKRVLTYPRTGSRYVTEDIFKTFPSLMERLIASGALPPSARSPHYNSRSVSDRDVTDHHAIIPTGEGSGALTETESKVYGEVLLRFREALSSLSEVMETRVIFDAGGVLLSSRSQEILTPGWRAVRGEGLPVEDEDGNEVTELLPAFHEGDICQVEGLSIREGMTRPKPFLTDATLLEAMEHAGREVNDEKLSEALKDCGLGTPATRAAEIETLLQRGYIERKGKSLIPTPLGLSVYELVRGKAVADVGMTALWESELSAIAEGRGDLFSFERGIRELTAKMVSELLSDPSSAVAALRSETLAGAACPLCGKSVLMTTKIVRCPDSQCGWKIWRSYYGKTLSEREVVALLGRGETREMAGFTGKSGKPFSGKIVLEEGGGVALRFVDHSKDEKGNDLLCPRCGEPVKVFSNRVVCPEEGCGWQMWRLVAGKPITDRMVPVLLTGGTTEVLRGFLSRTGKRFDASLRLDEAGEVTFVFQKTLKKKKSW